MAPAPQSVVIPNTGAIGDLWVFINVLRQATLPLILFIIASFIFFQIAEEKLLHHAQNEVGPEDMEK